MTCDLCCRKDCPCRGSSDCHQEIGRRNKRLAELEVRVRELEARASTQWLAVERANARLDAFRNAVGDAMAPVAVLAAREPVVHTMLVTVRAALRATSPIEDVKGTR